jgi:hypothetical protein
MIFFRWVLRSISGSRRRSVEVKQVERDQDNLGRLAFQFVLQDREVRGAVLGEHDDLAIDDRRTGTDVPGVVGDFAEAFCPVVAAPSEDLDGLVGEVDLHPVAVEFDLVKPAVAAGDLLGRRGEGGLDEAGVGRLDADGSRFLTLERHSKTPRH